MTGLLLPLLRARPGSRVLWVSSGGMYHPAALGHRRPRLRTRRLSRRRRVRAGQTRQVTLAQMWAERLRPDQISVPAMHPVGPTHPACAHHCRRSDAGPDRCCATRNGCRHARLVDRRRRCTAGHDGPVLAGPPPAANPPAVLDATPRHRRRTRPPLGLVHPTLRIRRRSNGSRALIVRTGKDTAAAGCCHPLAGSAA